MVLEVLHIYISIYINMFIYTFIIQYNKWHPRLVHADSGARSLCQAAFYMIGGMSDVKEKAAKLAAVAAGK